MKACFLIAECKLSHAKIIKKNYTALFFTIFIVFFYADASFAPSASSVMSSFFLAVLLMLRMIPTYRQLMTVDVPPLLINGRGCPVTGANPTATSMLNNACTTSNIASPMQRKAGKLFSHRLAMLPALYNNIMYSRATKKAPSMPISSMMMA